jgi:predicted glycosyltransferase
MRILIILNHPAHYYLFKYISRGLLDIGHEVRYVIKEKDILEDLLRCENVSYTRLSKRYERKQNALSIISSNAAELIKQNYNLIKYTNSYRPHIMMGTDISITHVGRLKNIPSLVFNEDDFEINKMFCSLAYPFATHIISPESCSVGKYSYKKITYNGIQKMAYLNPKYYTPDKRILSSLDLSPGQSYYIIRLVSLTAGHDIEGEHRGINNRILMRLIQQLEVEGRVFITSESALETNLRKYQIQIPPNKMHDAMALADLFIGDSQTMCAEAGILGTPFIRFNDFVGKISYLNELENDYTLGFGVRTNESERLFEIINSIFLTNNIRRNVSKMKEKLFEDKIDLTAFVIWLIDRYPESIEIIKENPDYQYEFR